MKKFVLIILFFSLFFIFYSCKKNENQNKSVPEESKSLIVNDYNSNVNELNDYNTNKDVNNVFIYESRDIFYQLFSDIKINYFDYGDNYIIKNNISSDYLLPKEWFIVQNNIIKIHYFPSVYMGPSVAEKYGYVTFEDIPDFFPFCVIINQYSDEYYLGKYIGKDINVFLNDFDNEYRLNNWVDALGNSFNYSFNPSNVEYVGVEINNNNCTNIDNT
jgi:hypothetical protein